MDFSTPDHIQQLAARVKQFVKDEVIPLEEETQHGATLSKARLARTRAQAKAPASGRLPCPRSSAASV